MEFLFDDGLIAIISRKDMKKQLVEYLDFMMAGQPVAEAAA